MSTQMIEINTNPTHTVGQPGAFAPQAATANAYDTITWHNADTCPHHPTLAVTPPDKLNPTAWFDYQIAPGATSDTLAPGPNTPDKTKPYILNYVCAIHPAETGQITVNPAL